MACKGKPQAASQRLSFAGTMIAAGLAMAMNSAPVLAQAGREAPVVCEAQQHSTDMENSFRLLGVLGEVLDQSYQLIRQGRASSSQLANHPFEAITAVLDQAVKQLLPAKKAGELSEAETSYLSLLAEARQKASRNASLIQQLTVLPAAFESKIDRAGLAKLASHSKQVVAGYNA
ncbi:hypothetical protein [Stutzerimonas nitrititolerans]|uniref:hypothetical protein n=1 Tax=Stutzerimonas nitrititolerans TaxID=2482751 RepID=UPI0028A74CBD|nr:hypothetical protein [Stutzerimonas nitrititolerans]